MHALLRTIAKWLMKLYFNVKVIGLENIPASGPLIVASNHQAVVDSYALPAFLEQDLIFLSKKEYFEKPGILGALLRWALTGRAIPVDRESVVDAVAAFGKLVEVLNKGGRIGIHPEATRAPPGAVYRGKTGAVNMAWKSGALVLPVAIIGSHRANKPGRRIPRFRARITLIIGQPMTFAPPIIFGKLKAAQKLQQETQTRHLMQMIAKLAGWLYVDEDAGDAKEALSKGE
ncbi:MAG: lysophospholipid acyltransferase family protein [Candidatus Saccharimonadales bacterium]